MPRQNPMGHRQPGYAAADQGEGIGKHFL
jgi:hypothetical protein